MACSGTDFFYLFVKHDVTTELHFVNENICREDDSNGSKSSYGLALHCHTWMPYKVPFAIPATICVPYVGMV
jgi:hypothetical protein